MSGKLFGVGVGPGDPELMTLKAVRIIESAQVIVLPESGGSRMLAREIVENAGISLSDKEVLLLDMPMTRDALKLEESHTKAAEKLVSYLEKGISVAFLTIGDPSVYSTYIYVHKKVQNLGYETELIPGVPSFCAVAAALNISLCEKDEALHIIPASYKGNDYLSYTGNKVLMKSGKQIEVVKEQLKTCGLYGKAQMVECCGLENEKIHKSLDDVAEDASYFSIIVVKEKGE